MNRSSEETYYPSPPRLSILDSWIGQDDGEESESKEEITKVVCVSRFTAILTSSSRLVVL
jgi:hypothetical protein